MKDYKVKKTETSQCKRMYDTRYLRIEPSEVLIEGKLGAHEEDGCLTRPLT